MIAFYQYIDAVLSLSTIPTICTLKASISSQIGLYSPLIVRPESNPKLASVSTWAENSSPKNITKPYPQIKDAFSISQPTKRIGRCSMNNIPTTGDLFATLVDHSN